ncbi:MAG TPA: nicotinate-nucleotide adenylyltransferase [Gammaproteobacteria bacterium]|nr:nicotinate-nucleotide adenylyltransferase [Gammaproteobacteria bacterium]
MICIFGGTFDPVHFGHLRPALDVQQALGIACVHLLPCRVPPHRAAPLVTAEQRLELLQLAVADEPALEIDERELHRDGPSYMVDTLESLRTAHGDEPVCLALGMDALRGLERWHRWQDIPALCHLVVMHRPGSPWPQQGTLADRLSSACVTDASALEKQPAGCVIGFPVTQMAVSSTQIRDLLAAGQSPRYLLPDAVLNRIRQEKWYAN